MPSIAVLLPCYNEAATIAQVVADYRAVLPEATIYVFDNNSRDNSTALATAAGATVVAVPEQGKGCVVRAMFRTVTADAYLMADADGTYDHTRARELLAPILSGEADMVIGTRQGTQPGTYPPGHRFGNRVFNLLVRLLFGKGLHDIFSGFRAFSPAFVQGFPAQSDGFEIESEMSIYALQHRIRFREIATIYGARPAGSASKLNTFRDGFRILCAILRMFVKEHRP